MHSRFPIHIPPVAISSWCNQTPAHARSLSAIIVCVWLSTLVGSSGCWCCCIFDLQLYEWSIIEHKIARTLEFIAQSAGASMANELPCCTDADLMRVVVCTIKQVILGNCVVGSKEWQGLAASNFKMTCPVAPTSRATGRIKQQNWSHWTWMPYTISLQPQKGLVWPHSV